MGGAGNYRLEIYDLAGRRVWRSPSQSAFAGEQVQVVWFGRNEQGQALASGTFIARVYVDNLPAAKRLCACNCGTACTTRAGGIKFQVSAAY